MYPDKSQLGFGHMDSTPVPGTPHVIYRSGGPRFEEVKAARAAGRVPSASPEANDQEDLREAQTSRVVKGNRTVEDLENRQKYLKEDTPISGDALARAKAGQPSKSHRDLREAQLTELYKRTQATRKNTSENFKNL